MFLDILIVCAVGYAFGCLQWSYILVHWLKKQDIRKSGFGNAGASNTFASHGKRLGAGVAVLDALKALVSVRLIFFLMAQGTLSDLSYLPLLNGLFVILGHNFPFFMGFKGGKGTASLVGVIFGLNMWYGLISVCVILSVALFSNYIVIGTMALLIYFVFVVYSGNYGPIAVAISLFMSAMSIFLHLPNFKRIASSTETKVRSSLSKNKKEKSDKS